MNPPTITPAAVLEHFRPGAVIYIPGAVGELDFLRGLLAADPGRLAGVTLVSGLVPGMNDFDYAGLNADARLRVFMLSGALRGSFDAGRVELMPFAYTDTAAYLEQLQPDLAILHLAPQRDGDCSFGVCADFGPIVARNARSRIGVLNTAMPVPGFGPTWPMAKLDAVVEIDAPFRTYADPPPGDDLLALAAQVATLVPNGAAVQTGIGAAPAAVWRALTGHEGLRLRSGMVTDGFLQAYKAGAMTAGGHVAGVAYGGAELLDWLDGQDRLTFADAFATHGPEALAEVTGLIAINSALEVDLLGQVNLEWQGGRLISGVGGPPDFVRAARRSPGGRSILALPATAKGGTISRISARLNAPAPSLARSDLDTVITEYGVAQVRGLSLDRRAAALIAIAAPAHRESLVAAWRDIRAIF